MKLMEKPSFIALSNEINREFNDKKLVINWEFLLDLMFIFKNFAIYTILKNSKS